MKQCDTIQSLLRSYLTGELWPEDRSKVEHHLRSCGGCRQTLEEYKQIGADLELENEEVVPPVLRRKILQCIQQELLKEHQIFGRDNWPGIGKIVTALSIGIVVQVTLFGLLSGTFLPNINGAIIGVVVTCLIWCESTVPTTLIMFGGFQQNYPDIRKMRMMALIFTKENIYKYRPVYYFLK